MGGESGRQGAKGGEGRKEGKREDGTERNGTERNGMGWDGMGGKRLGVIGLGRGEEGDEETIHVG
eukprot:274860-Hanusia_phi.AAC.1